MIRRLWHWLAVGHQWQVRSAIFNSGTNQYRGSGPIVEDEKQLCWGFTQALFGCSCGVFKHARLVGNHSALKAADELSELERLAKLK